MVCLGFEPGAAGWKARTNQLIHGTLCLHVFVLGLLRLRLEVLALALSGKQCDQIARFCFHIWQFTAMALCPIS